MASDNEILNARILSTFLGREDHGIFIVDVRLDYGGVEQSYQRAVDAETLLEEIEKVLKAAHVEHWEQLPGRYVRVRREGRMARELLPILGYDD